MNSQLSKRSVRMIGDKVVRSMRPSAVNSTKAIPRNDSVFSDVHLHCMPCVMPNSKAGTATTRSASLSQSRHGGLSCSGIRERFPGRCKAQQDERHVHNKVEAPAKRAHRHPAGDRTDREAAAVDPEKQNPMTLPRSHSGKALDTIAAEAI